MNGAQQAQRRTAVLDLQDQLNKLAEAFDQELRYMTAGLIDRIDSTQVAMLTASDKLQGRIVSEENARLNADTHTFEWILAENSHLQEQVLPFERLHNTRGWYGIWLRLRWLVMGCQ